MPAEQLAPVVPVAAFWSPPRDVTLAEVARLWAGLTDPGARFKSIAISTEAAGPLAQTLHIAPGATVRIASSAEVKVAVRASPTTLGLLPAAEVSPDVRALSVNGVSLFGSARTPDPAQWPLLVLWTGAAFSTPRMWTLVAGGDVNLGRNVYAKAVTLGDGPDFPWAAGNAVIRGYECCGAKNGPLVVARDAGPPGAFRQRLFGADLALVNLEGSAPNHWATSGDSLVFTFDPALLAGLAHAGVDLVSLANNHIRNGGDQGVIETGRNLDVVGIEHVGAGANDTAARQPAWLEAAGLRVAVLGYSSVNYGPISWATSTRPGAAMLIKDQAVADIQAARAAGADIVIVMPHWGEEYTYYIDADQRAEAAAFVAAGADLVLGSHSHWVGGLQSLDGPNGPALVDYSLGDLLFNLNHDIESQEGVLLTLTFSGTRLVQVELSPTVMIDGAQVGLLDPAADGAPVLDAIRAASRGMLGW